MLSQDRARLGSSTTGAWAAGTRLQLGYWKSLTGALASVGGQHGGEKSGKSLPRVKVINPSATTEECSRREQPRAALGSQMGPHSTQQGDHLLGEDMSAMGKANPHELVLSHQAFFSILHRHFCQLHLIPIWLSKASMGQQHEVSCNLAPVCPRHNIHLSTPQFPLVNWIIMRSINIVMLHHPCGK